MDGQPGGEACYYVYGVLPWPSEAELDGTVYLLPYRDLAAIVRRVAPSEFGPGALEQNLRDAAWLEAAVLDHQRVLDRALASRRRETDGCRPTPVPMRFGTLYRSEDGVRQALAARYDALSTTLARLAGKCEWGVKVYSDRAALARTIEAPTEEVGSLGDRVRALRAHMAGLGQGTAYFAKKKLEAALAEAAESLGDEYAERGHHRLVAFAAQAVLNPPHDRSITGREMAMVLNAACLVADARLDDFRAELARLESDYGPRGLHYELTGPWAPYHFVGDGPGREERAAEVGDGPVGRG